MSLYANGLALRPLESASRGTFSDAPLTLHPMISQENVPRQLDKVGKTHQLEGKFLILRGIEPFLECLKLQLLDAEATQPHPPLPGIPQTPSVTSDTGT